MHSTIVNLYNRIYMKVSGLAKMWNAENKAQFNYLISHWKHFVRHSYWTLHAFPLQLVFGKVTAWE